VGAHFPIIGPKNNWPSLATLFGGIHHRTNCKHKTGLRTLEEAASFHCLDSKGRRTAAGPDQQSAAQQSEANGDQWRPSWLQVGRKLAASEHSHQRGDDLQSAVWRPPKANLLPMRLFCFPFGRRCLCAPAAEARPPSRPPGRRRHWARARACEPRCCGPALSRPRAPRTWADPAAQ